MRNRSWSRSGPHAPAHTAPASSRLPRRGSGSTLHSERAPAAAAARRTRAQRRPVLEHIGPSRSIFSRMRSPPCTTSRSSHPAPPGDACGPAARRAASVHASSAQCRQSAALFRARPGARKSHPEPTPMPRRNRAPARRAGRATCRRRGPARSWPAAAPCRSHPTAAGPVRCLHAVEVKQQPPDRIGGAAAIVEQLRAVLVAVLHDVLLERAEQVRRAQRIGSECVRKACRSGTNDMPPARRRLVAGPQRCQLTAIRAQVHEPLGSRLVPFVGEIVRGAGEPVDGGHGRAQPPRTQHRRDWKVLVVIDAHRWILHRDRWRRGASAARVVLPLRPVRV